MVAIISLAVLFVEYVLLGGLLFSYNASWLIWLGTQAVTVYLCWSGTDAIALAIAWIVSVIWAGVFAKAWPQTIAWMGMLAFSTALFIVWALALIFAFTLALTKNYLNSLGISKIHSFETLVFVTVTGIALGWLTGNFLFLSKQIVD